MTLGRDEDVPDTPGLVNRDGNTVKPTRVLHGLRALDTAVTVLQSLATTAAALTGECRVNVLLNCAHALSPRLLPFLS